MSDNIAQLGITIDSSSVPKATTALNGLTTAAKAAAPAVSALQSAASPATAALGNLSKGANDNSESLRGQREALRGLVGDVSLLTPAFGGVIAVASELYLSNQRLAEGWAGVKTAIGGLITPTNLLIGGLVGIAAGGAIALKSIADSEVALADLGERAQASVGYLHQLQEAASFKGVDSEAFTKDFTTLATETAQAKDNMGALVELFRANNVQAGTLKDNVSTLANLIKNASEPQKYSILQQLGLSDTRSAVQFWSEGAAGIASVTAAAVSFGQVADESLIAKSRAFSETWNKDTTLLTNGLKSAFIEATTYAQRFGDFVASMLGHVADLGTNKLKQAFAGSLSIGSTRTTSSSNIDDYYKAVGGAGTSTSSGSKSADDGTKDLAATKSKIAQNQLYISTLGNLATVQDEVKSKQNALDLANIAGAGVTSRQRAAILDYTAATALGVTAIRTQTAEQQLSLTTMNMGVGAAAAYSAVQTRINEAIIKGAPLNAQQVSQLQAVANELGKATQAAATYKVQQDAVFGRGLLGLADNEQAAANAMKQLWGGDWQSHMNDDLATFIKVNSTLTDLKSTSQTALSGFLSDLTTGKNGAVALQNALTSVEKKLLDMIANQAISGLFRSLASIGGGGVTAGNDPFGASGLFSSHHSGGVVGSESGPSRALPLSTFIGAPRFHGGGLVGGERAIVARDGEAVLTPGQLRMLGPAGQSAPAPIINIHNHSGGQVQTQKRTGANGASVTDVVIGIVGTHMAQGGFDSQLSARTNTKKQPFGR